jgi:hypothetical protein
MRVLGYSFRQTTAAMQARQALVDRYLLAPNDARLGDLADDGSLLAVRAREDNLAGVKEVLHAHGGEQLTDVDEGWTKSPSN